MADPIIGYRQDQRVLLTVKKAELDRPGGRLRGIAPGRCLPQGKPIQVARRYGLQFAVNSSS
jgi:hypothetical protein